MDYHPNQATIVFVTVFTVVYLGLLIRNAARHVIDLYDLLALSMPALLPAIVVFAPGLAGAAARLVGVSFSFLLLFGALFVVAFLLLYRLTVLARKLEARQAAMIQDLALLRKRVEDLEKTSGSRPGGPQ